MSTIMGAVVSGTTIVAPSATKLRVLPMYWPWRWLNAK